MPRYVNKLWPGLNFANPKEVARGQEPWGEAATESQEGLLASRWRGKGLCAAVPGLQSRRRESADRAFPQTRKAPRRTQAPLSLLTNLSPGTYSGGLGDSPPHRGLGSTAGSGASLDIPALSKLVALPAPNSPRLDDCFSEPAFPIQPLPHVIGIPPGELANILIHVL